jgi:hypothetical protein
MNVTGLPRNRGVNSDWRNDAYLLSGSVEGKGVWLVEGDQMNEWWVIVREGTEFLHEGEVTTAALQGDWETVRMALLETVPNEHWFDDSLLDPNKPDPYKEAEFRDHELEGAARAVVSAWDTKHLADRVRWLDVILDERAAGKMPADTAPVPAHAWNHTPGPWRHQTPRGPQHAIDKKWEIVAPIESGELVIVGEHTGIDCLKESNARLIAAAPELLEAAVALLEGNDVDARSKLISAIAKATGGSK